MYNPDPSLPEVNGHTGSDYSQVLHENGHVLEYDLHFVSAPIAEAKLRALQELPPDAHVQGFAVKDTCAQMLVTSAILGKELGTNAIGDPAGAVEIEFGSGLNEDHYDPGAVSDALFMLAPSTNISGLPAC